jgi:hypothetical protein
VDRARFAHHVDTACVQHFGRGLPERSVVVDDKDPRWHAGTLPGAARRFNGKTPCRPSRVGLSRGWLWRPLDCRDASVVRDWVVTREALRKESLMSVKPHNRQMLIVAIGLILVLAGLTTIVFGDVWIGVAAFAVGVVASLSPTLRTPRSHGLRG